MTVPPAVGAVPSSTGVLPVTLAMPALAAVRSAATTSCPARVAATVAAPAVPVPLAPAKATSGVTAEMPRYWLIAMNRVLLDAENRAVTVVVPPVATRA